MLLEWSNDWIQVHLLPYVLRPLPFFFHLWFFEKRGCGVVEILAKRLDCGVQLCMESGMRWIICRGIGFRPRDWGLGFLGS